MNFSASSGTGSRRKSFFDHLRSLQTAAIIIGIIILFSIISTFIPQNYPREYYFRIYPEGLASLITFLRFHLFFRSPVFLILVLLFVINLFLCTVYRIVTRVKNVLRWRIGPDLIHISLLIMIIGGGVTWLNRKEASVQLRAGDAMELPGGSVITVTGLDYHTYPDNRPREWQTAVEIVSSEGDSKLFTIEVNKPLKLNGLTLYQSTFGSDPENGEFVTGLRIVDDPGYAPVFAGLLLLLAGLGVTFIQKVSDRKKRGDVP